jgi:hypothetical protein
MKDTMNIKIRAGHPDGRDLDYAEAVRAAMGLDERTSHIYVTPVDEAGRAVFGLDAELTARQIRFGEDSDAKVGIGGIMSHSPEVAMTRIAAYTQAAQIAAAANAAAAALREQTAGAR